MVLFFVTLQVTNILELLKNSCSRCIEAAALFMDELASVLKKGCLDRKVEVSDISHKSM